MHDINTIKFGILGDEDIKCMSVVLVNNPSLKELQGTVYDSSLGCSSTQSLCATCAKDIWKCPGHFGHIDLNCKIILFWKETVRFLKCFCGGCRRLRADVKGSFDACLDVLSKCLECERCGEKTADYKLVLTHEVYVQKRNKKEKTTSRMLVDEIQQIFENVRDEDLLSIGIDPARTHPKNLILSVFPVIPICCRPKVSVGDVFYDDDLSISLMQIIKLTWKIKQATTPETRSAAVMQLQMKILYYCNNSKGKDIHSSNNKVMLGIRERISKKTGLIRQNIMGKRSDYTARSVVGPHPMLELDEVAVPISIADTLTLPEFVTPFNKARLEGLVRDGRAPYITRVGGTKVSTDRVRRAGSTVLKHGDVIDGKKVTDCNMIVKPGTVIVRDGVPMPFVEKLTPVRLNCGDVVHRRLEDGDPIVLNRQPTLHKNSMMGMRVKRWPGKTICVNLAITAGFNMDFDGDEGNLNLPQSPEALAEVKHLMNAKNHIVSNQTNKAAVVIVQDTLLGAYLMTRSDVPMRREEFFDCLLQVKHSYDPIGRVGSEFTSRRLWDFLFPPDFHYDQKNLRVCFGRLVSGVVNKSHLKSGSNSLIRILFMEYGPDVVNDFVTNLQRMVTTFLLYYPHSISVSDCLIPSEAKQQIEETVDKYIHEANTVSKIPICAMREKKISEALNKAKDIGNKIAKDHLSPRNNLAAMVESGSKGDYFNLSQIMGLLGQQNIAGGRMRKDIDHRFRTLPYYPRVIFDEKAYEAGGFVRSSFVEGLNPMELFFHTKAGREGIIDTSHRTGITGYMERKMVKIAEDLVVHYDGTVRDGRKNIIQLLYGNYGFDPIVTVEENVPIPVDVVRTAQRLDFGATEPLSEEAIRDLTNSLTVGTDFTPRVVRDIYETRIKSAMDKRLRRVKLSPERYEEFRREVVSVYFSRVIAPGEAVGIIAAQSIGEQQTQQMLNTFHTTGKLRRETNRITELLNMSKTVKNEFTKIYFKQKLSPSEIRFFMRSVIYVSAGDLVKTTTRDGDDVLTVHLDVGKVFKFRVTSREVAEKLAGVAVDELTVRFHEFEKWTETYVSGIKNITDYNLEYENGEWYAIVEGTNLIELIALDFVDGKRIYTNNLWHVYETFGIGAVRRQIFSEFLNHCDTNMCHLSLMTDLMTFRGRPMAVDRYTMRQSTVGPLSKSTFEESMDILTTAAVKSETETVCGVSAAIMVGNKIKMGTGFMGLKYNFKGT